MRKPHRGRWFAAAAVAACLRVGRGLKQRHRAVVTAAADAAADALAHTPEQLEVLARAGVVDAGGRGLVVILDALVETVTGIRRDPGPSALPIPWEVHDLDEGGGAYEVMFPGLAHDDETLERIADAAHAAAAQVASTRS